MLRLSGKPPTLDLWYKPQVICQRVGFPPNLHTPLRPAMTNVCIYCISLFVQTWIYCM